MTDDPGLDMHVLSRPEALEDCRADWDDCIAATGSDIYFSVDWQRAWWAHYGRGRRFVGLRIARGDRTLGVLPFAIETLWAGPLPVRVARLAGLDPNYPALSLPLAPEIVVEALALALARLAGPEGCSGILLSPLSALAPEGDLADRVAQRAGLMLLSDTVERQHTVMHLPDDFDAWLATLSKSRRREYRRDLARLAERASLSDRVSTAETAPARLEAFIAMHGAQWAEAGKAGHFGDWPGSADFCRDLVARLAPSNRAHIEEHCADGQPLSMQLSFRQGRRIYWRLTARTGDTTFASFGPGRVGLVERVREAIAEGATLIEAAAGEYEYKLSYGGTLVGVRRLVVARPTWLVRTRLRLLLRWSDLLNLVYYRAWFLKFAPRLRQRFGGRPRPLWRIWIRSRL